MLRTIWTSCLLLLPTCAWAHGDERCDCHHWENPLYISEMRLQMVIMGACLFAVIAASLIRRAIASRRVRV